jgi:hypothetical protein
VVNQPADQFAVLDKPDGRCLIKASIAARNALADEGGDNPANVLDHLDQLEYCSGMEKRTPFAAKGTIVKDANGVPTFEFVEDVYSGDAFMYRQVVSLPDRKHPEPHTPIHPALVEWHRQKTGRSV